MIIIILIIIIFTTIFLFVFIIIIIVITTTITVITFEIVIITTKFKGALEGLRQFFASESTFKKMKNAFYFTLKALSVLKIFKFLS